MQLSLCPFLIGLPDQTEFVLEYLLPPPHTPAVLALRWFAVSLPVYLMFCEAEGISPLEADGAYWLGVPLEMVSNAEEVPTPDPMLN